MDTLVAAKNLVFLAPCLFLCVPLPHVLADVDFSDFRSVDGLKLNGKAAVVGAKVRLVPAAEGQNGSIYAEPKQQVELGFDTAFRFQVTDGSGSFGAADGFSFIVQDSRHSSAGSAGELALGGGGEGQGYAGIDNSLAVEFDTYQSPDDPNGNHISIQTRGVEPNSSSHVFSLGAATDIPHIADGSIHSAHITYEGGTVNIYMDGALRLSVAVDLAKTLELDSGAAWVGFTAGTGGAYANYDILQWSFKEGGIIPADCNKNGVSDLEDIRRSVSLDANGDGVPDECQLGPFFNAATGNYYELVLNSRINWEEAMAAAEIRAFSGIHGYLTTITSEAENSFLKDKFGLVGNIWFGASDADSEGVWRWVTGPEAGDPLAFDKWAPGEPNNTNNEEHYAEWNQGRWNDTSNRRFPVTGFLVEYPTNGEVALQRFIRGDVDGGGKLTVADAIRVLMFLFTGEADLHCLDAADADNSGVLNVSDAIWILGFLFLGTEPPVAPFGDCGVDPVQDGLDCASYTACPLP